MNTFGSACRNESVAGSPAKSLIAVIAFLSTGAGLSACSSFQGGALDAMEAFTNGEQQGAFVEAYIEFGTGDGRWAAPQAVLLHVDASDAELARIELGPFEVLKGAAVPSISTSSESRGPASVEGNAESAAAEKSEESSGEPKNYATFTSEEAREQMARLSIALDQDSSKGGRGCLFPIRARLVKADGGIIDREGCRGQRGWNRTASEIAERWLSLSLRRRLSSG